MRNVPEDWNRGFPQIPAVHSPGGPEDESHRLVSLAVMVPLQAMFDRTRELEWRNFTQPERPGKIFHKGVI